MCRRSKFWKNICKTINNGYPWAMVKPQVIFIFFLMPFLFL